MMMRCLQQAGRLYRVQTRIFQNRYSGPENGQA